MKTNHQRDIVKRQDHHQHYWSGIANGLLKHESNRDRRRYDRNALALTLAGDDGMTFAPNQMGNPWHWD